MTEPPSHADRRAETMRAMRDWQREQKPKHAGPPKTQDEGEAVNTKTHDRNRARRRLARRIAERVGEYLVYNEREFDLVDVAGLIEAMLPLTRAEAAKETK